MTQKYYVDRLLPLYCDAIRSMRNIDDKSWLLQEDGDPSLARKSYLYGQNKLIGRRTKEIFLESTCIYDSPPAARTERSFRWRDPTSPIITKSMVRRLDSTSTNLRFEVEDCASRRTLILRLGYAPKCWPYPTLALTFGELKSSGNSRHLSSGHLWRLPSKENLLRLSCFLDPTQSIVAATLPR